MKCVWCGTDFTQKHHSEKYCCDECRKNARRKQNRDNFFAWYSRNRHQLWKGDSKRSMGCGHLGSHPRPDFLDESRIIKKEMARFGIS